MPGVFTCWSAAAANALDCCRSLAKLTLERSVGKMCNMATSRGFLYPPTDHSSWCGG